MRVKLAKLTTLAFAGAALVSAQAAQALSLLGGGYSDHLFFMEFYSALPFDEAKKCALDLHNVGLGPPVKVKEKKTKTGIAEQMEFGKYGFDMLESERGEPLSRFKARYSTQFIKMDYKTLAVSLPYEKCAGNVDDPKAATAFSAAAAAMGPGRAVYETKFSVAKILNCMMQYPQKVSSSYEMYYVHPQITAFSGMRYRIGWARARSMTLAQQKFSYSHFILSDQGRTLVGFDGASKDGLTPSTFGPGGDKYWTISLARSCAVHGDDREVLYWPRSGR